MRDVKGHSKNSSLSGEYLRAKGLQSLMAGGGEGDYSHVENVN